MDPMTDLLLADTLPIDQLRRFESRPNAAIAAEALGVPVLDVVIPVYNEEAALADSVHRLHRHLRDTFPYPVRITIADNASVDDTPRIAAELAAELVDVRAVRLEQKGRGRALHQVWSESDAAVLAYMDVDLSTDLAALAPLVAPLISGHSDLAIGTRLSRGSRVVRGAKREIISRCYNFILKSTLSARFSDAQCGFKAIRADVARSLLPAGSSTPSCWCSPSAAAFGSTRCPSTGSTIPTAGWTSWPPRPRTSRAWAACCSASPTVRFR
jgi:cellulose synthase/poly-beta-1,6-N-acetylglucosamine synthase-like glycosyltransferase